MPDWKEMYLHMFRATERSINIQIDAQKQCEEMYIRAPEQELRVLSKQDKDDPRVYVTSTPDYRGMYQHLYLETHKAVLALMDAQIHCDSLSANSMSELLLMSQQDMRGLIFTEDDEKNSRT